MAQRTHSRRNSSHVPLTLTLANHAKGGTIKNQLTITRREQGFFQDSRLGERVLDPFAQHLIDYAELPGRLGCQKIVPLKRVFDTAVAAFSDFLTRDMAIVALAFVVLFKFTDALAGAMTAPFVIDLGFTRNEYW